MDAITNLEQQEQFQYFISNTLSCQHQDIKSMRHCKGPGGLQYKIVRNNAYYLKFYE